MENIHDFLAQLAVDNIDETMVEDTTFDEFDEF